MRGVRLLLIVSIVFLFFISGYAQSDKIQKPQTIQPYSIPTQPPPVAPKPRPDFKPDSPYSLTIVNFSTSSTTINYGDEVTLKWTIRVNNLSGLKLEITPDIGIIPRPRTDYRNESFAIEGSKTIRPSKTGKYLLKVSAQDPIPRLDIGPTGHIHQSKILAEKILIITVKNHE